MKRFSFLQVVVLAALLVTVASCGAPLYSEGGSYEDAPARANVYYGDPYYGGVNTIVVERDPYTGRYYQVSPGYYGGGIYSAPVNPYYNRRYNNNRYYNNNRNYNTNRSYNSRNNSNSNNNGYYKTYPQRQQVQPQRTPVQQTPQYQQQRSEAKDAILGKKRN